MRVSDAQHLPTDCADASEQRNFGLYANQPQDLLQAGGRDGYRSSSGGQEKVTQLGLDKQISFAKEDCTALSFPDNRFDARFLHGRLFRGNPLHGLELLLNAW